MERPVRVVADVLVVVDLEKGIRKLLGPSSGHDLHIVREVVPRIFTARVRASPALICR